jgi:hypothetical protein
MSALVGSAARFSGSSVRIISEIFVAAMHRTGLLSTGFWAFRKHLVVVASVSANPFCVAGDGFLAVFHFYGDDVMAFGVSDLFQEASLEVC